MKTYYEVLGLSVSATAEEIKRTFRREISKYHPDKVQHLGHEFQEMAAALAADLTEAYRVLMDPALRAEYDAGLLQQETGAPVADDAQPQPKTQPKTRVAPREAEAAAPPASEARRPPAQGASIDVVRKATLARLRSAVDAVLGADVGSVHGFDAAYLARPRKALFRKGEPTIRLLVKLVPHVDASAVAEVWEDALAATTPDAVVGVMLLGYGMATARELSLAVTEQRQITGRQGPALIPVDVRDWDALLPADVPAPLRLVVERLRNNQA